MNRVAPDRSDLASVRRARARRGEGERLHGEILDAFDALLATTGNVDAISIRAIAEAIGVTSPAIYLHFADKDALVFAACNRHFRDFRLALEQADDLTGSSVERLQRIGRAYCEWGIRNPEAYRVMFMSREIGPPEGTPIEEIHGLAALAQLFGIIELGITRGEFVLTDVTILAMTIWGAVHGVVALAIEQQAGGLKQHMIDYDTDQAITVMLDAIMTGLRAPAAPGAS